MRQFQGERLDFDFLRTDILLCLLLSLIQQRLNNVDYLLFGIRIEIQLVKLDQ